MCSVSTSVFPVHKQFSVRVEVQRLWGSVRWNAGEPQSYSFLMQRIAVAIQIGNATTVIASLPVNAATSISFEL